MASTFIVAFGMIYTDVSAKYGVSYDNDTIEVMNQMESIQNISSEIQERHSEDTIDRNWYDIIGNVIADGIDVTRLAATSYTSFMTMADKAANKLGVNNVFVVMMFVMVMVLIFVAIILRIKLGQNV